MQREIIQQEIGDNKYHTKAVTERFLFAVDRIMGNRSNGKITQNQIGEALTISGSNISRMREQPDKHFVTVEALARLVEHYGISANWLLLNRGRMHSDEDMYNAYENLNTRLTELENTVNAIEVKLSKKR